MKSQRLIQMEQYILDETTVTMEELCAQFDISISTARRDIASLIRDGSIEKVYGGVRASKNYPPLAPFETRETTRREEKYRIGRRAAEEVGPGDIIFLDSGTTTMHMIGALAEKNPTVVTHNLQAINAAAPIESIAVLALPGALQRRTFSFTGLDAMKLLRNYHIRTAFMAATGLSMHGVSNSSPLEYEIKRTAMAQSERKVLLLDSGKFGKTALLTYAQLTEFDAVVTGAQPPEEYIRAIEGAGCELILANGKELCYVDHRMG